MQRITRARLVLSLALVGALALAGCGGGDDAYSISAEDQARIDTLTDDVAAANKKAADDLAAAKTQAEADLKTAQDEIDSLTAQIGMAATDDMAATGLHKQLADARKAAATAQMTIGELTATIGMMPGDDGMGGSGLQGDLAMYKATAADLEMQIGMMDDPTTEADESSGLQGQLAMYQAKAADLQDTLGMMTDGDMAATGLYKELADAQSMVAKLQTQIGDMPGEDGMGGSGLEADLAKYKVMVGDLEMKIGMMDDPTTTEADESSGLYKQLADAMAEAQMYKDTIGMEADGDNPEATGLYKMIADAEAKATMYKAQLDTLQGKIDTDDADEMSAAAKALLTKALANVTTAAPGAVMVKVADGELKPEVADYTLGAMPDMIEGWMGATLMNKDGNTIVVYSDRGATGGTMFLDTYDGMIAADGTRTYDIGAPDNTNDEVEWANVKRTDTLAGPGLKPGSTMFTGSVMDVPGTFSCVAVATSICTAPPRHTDGAVDLGTSGTDNVTGLWKFVPDDPSARIAGADSEYLTFGWWLMKDEAGMPASLQLIANAMGMGAGANMEDPRTDTNTEGGVLRGTATYKGAAAGKYAIASTTDESYEGGHFTAMATIEADFDVDNTPTVTDNPLTEGNQRDGIKLSGMIDNFMTGDVSRPDWMVKLMADGNVPSDGVATDENRGLQPVADLVTDLVDAATVLSTEWTVGTAQVGVGAWVPTFSGTETGTSHPKAVTGTFNASLGAASRLEGAFGANKVME